MKFLNLKKSYFLHIKSAKHNIFFNLTDEKGNTIYLISGGMFGFYGKKARNRAVFRTLFFKMLKKIKKNKIKEFSIIMKNAKIRPYRILRELKRNKLKLNSIRDKSLLSHQGCRRSRKKR